MALARNLPISSSPFRKNGVYLGDFLVRGDLLGVLEEVGDHSHQRNAVDFRRVNRLARSRLAAARRAPP